MMTPEEIRRICHERAQVWASKDYAEENLIGLQLATLYGILADLADQLKALRERVDGLEAKRVEPQDVSELVGPSAWVVSLDQPSEVYCRECDHPRGAHDNFGCSVGREFDSTFICRCSVRYDDD
jgi:hypothetical protein